MSNCTHCGFDHGHYSTVTYTPLDCEVPLVYPRKMVGKKVIEAYWFCHSCAKLAYETDSDASHLFKE